MNPPTEQLIRDYLNRLSLAARGKLDPIDRQSLLDRTRAQIEAECGGTSVANAAAVRRALAGLGDPTAIIELERAKVSVGSAPMEGGTSTMQAEPDDAVDDTSGHDTSGHDITGHDTSGPDAVSGDGPGGTAPPPRDPPERSGAAKPSGTSGPFDLDRHGLDEHGDDRTGTGQAAFVLDQGSPRSSSRESSTERQGTPSPSRPPTRRVENPPSQPKPVNQPQAPAAQRTQAEQARLERRAKLERELTVTTTARPGLLARLVLSAMDIARQNTVELIAVLLLGVGGVIYPPIWLVGAMFALPSKKWDIRDKFIGITLPILLAIVGTVLFLVLGGQRGSLGSYAFEAWLAAERLSRFLALAGGGYLLWGLRRGRRTPKQPPWNVPHKLG